jgi:hypothetical protein
MASMNRDSFASGLVAAACLALCTAASREAVADPPPPVDVALNEPPPPRRVATIEWNPVSLVINRLSANVEIVPVDHHALVLSPFYFNSRTSSFTDGSVEVPSQRFEGFGGEIGYRYYWGRGGPRGLFIGPSLLLAEVQATAVNGSKTSIDDVGIAADIGYQMLVAERWVVSLGAGGQYTFTSKSIPDQQMPANIYANAGVQPRILFALGCAF